jgi:thiol:disulfide interchange protein DsbC
MKFFKSLTLAICSAFVFVSSVQALPQEVSQPVIAKITAKLYQLGLQTNKVNKTPIEGLLEVTTNRGVFYTSADGAYFMQGRLFDMDNGMVNLTDKAMSSMRLEGMEQFKDSMIVFPAEEEKHQITVFTDTTCGYCRKLHAQIDEYNDLGITVRYMAFPRGGVNSRSFDDIKSVWCAKDQRDAMTKAKNSGQIPEANCNAPIAQHYNLGQAVGVTGTPAIMLEDGQMIPGYKPPQALFKMLETQ